MKEVYIVGGGPSLKSFDFKKLEGRDCIVANQAIFDVPHARFFITVDQTYMHKIASRMEEFKAHPAHKLFVVNMATGFLDETPPSPYPSIGQIVDRRMGLKYDFKHFDQVIKSNKCEGISDSYPDFRNGANSGYSALQLAIILGYKEINLLGIDLTAANGETHYHKAYSGFKAGFIEKSRDHFINGIREIKQFFPSVELYSCSPISILNQHIAFRAVS